MWPKSDSSVNWSRPESDLHAQKNYMMLHTAHNNNTEVNMEPTEVRANFPTLTIFFLFFIALSKVPPAHNSPDK